MDVILVLIVLIVSIASILPSSRPYHGTSVTQTRNSIVITWVNRFPMAQDSGDGSLA